MYLCSCNALTDADFRRAVDQGGADRPASVFAACDAKAQCGSCVRAMCALLGFGHACAERAEGWDGAPRSRAPRPFGLGAVGAVQPVA